MATPWPSITAFQIGNALITDTCGSAITTTRFPASLDSVRMCHQFS